jgi:hypothetical protein
MAEDNERLNPEQYLGIVRAALDPDERKFFKAHLGQDSPDMMDYILPQGRFAKARDLRETIVRTVLGQAMAHEQNATVGEAQSQFADFPVPPSAMRPGKPIEEAGPFVRQTAPGFPEKAISSPGIFEAGPTKPDVIPGREPQFTLQPTPEDRIHPGQPEVNREALLPNSYQNLLTQRQHREGLRGTANQQGGDLKKYEDNFMLGRTAFIEANGRLPNQQELLDIQQQAMGAYDKQPRPGTQGARKLTGEADIASAKGGVAPQQAMADLQKTQAGTELDEAHTKTDNDLRMARLNEILARTRLEDTQAGDVGKRATSAESKLALMEAGKALELFKTLEARGMIDAKGMKTLLEGVVRKVAPDLEASGVEPSMMEGLFGIEPKQLTIGPKGTMQAPKGQPAPKAMTPTETTPTPDDDKAALRSLGSRLKEGESQVYKGKRYTRKGNKLVGE